MDPTAADGDGGRRREAAGGDEGGAISGSEVAADAAAAPEVGAVAMGGTQTPEPTNARAPSGAWAAQATAAHNPICRLGRKALSTTEGERFGLDDNEAHKRRKRRK
ncbi:hypothetical protein PF004_g17193 [Phytophthora fragariae]|uniref:Uncharacterized protein n=1 Tax=Phytophthora fragariae TaxID=53985 RepID=A0A6G0NG64_9STRA|nr:hypothetical protein PF004_g17193 [Phytophthora fragariae]